jgi:hypothetical protein
MSLETRRAYISTLASTLALPDSLLAKEATEVLREYSTDLLINHCIRFYLFAAEQGRQQKLRFDPNSSRWSPHFTISVLSRSSRAKMSASRSMAQGRREFLAAYNVSQEQVQTVWEAIVLRTPLRQDANDGEAT